MQGAVLQRPQSVCVTQWQIGLVLLLGFVVFGAEPATAQDNKRWVTDRLEITLRTGKSTRQSIVRMLPSGTRVELLETDRESGYSRVRTRSGTDGWVLTRYLLREPPARILMPTVESRLAQTEKQNAELKAQLAALREERAALQQQLTGLEQSGSGLQKELDDIRRLSANVIEIENQNKSLRQRLIDSERLLEELEAANQRLASRSSREWFVVGAAVVVAGILLGVILPRIRWRKKSSWGDL